MNTSEEKNKEVEVKEEVKETAITKVTKYLDSEIVKARFADVLGDRNVGSYIASVMITVKDSEALLKCSPASIYTSALRAASLRLSVDPATGQAYLVPFGGHATLIVGYKGLYDMAVRTGKYRYINVGPIYEGMKVEENPITGFHSIVGQRAGDKIIGWIGAFEMNPERGQVTGFAKTFYMSVEEIHSHAREYSKGYDNPKGTWKKETRKMERKTVLRLLLRKWGYLDPADAQVLNESEDETIIDANPDIYNIPDYNEEEDAPKPRKATEEAMKELGFGEKQ